MFDVNVVHGLNHGSYGGCAVSHVPAKSNERPFLVWIQPLQLNDWVLASRFIHTSEKNAIFAVVPRHRLDMQTYVSLRAESQRDPTWSNIVT